MTKLNFNYFIHILLYSKYKIILFLIFYLICIKLHYIDLNINNFVECMMRAPSTKLPLLRDKNLFPESLQSHAGLLEFSSPNYTEEQKLEISRLIERINYGVDNYQSRQSNVHDGSIDRITQLEGKLTLSERLRIKNIHNLGSNLDTLLTYKLKKALPDFDEMLNAQSKDLSSLKQTQEALAIDIRTVQEKLVNYDDRFNSIEQQLLDNTFNNKALNEEIMQKITNLESIINTKASNLAGSELQSEINTNIKAIHTELTNEINTRKVLETRVTNLEEELREIRRALMFRGTIMEPFLQQQLTLNEVKQTTQETNIAVLPR